MRDDEPMWKFMAKYHAIAFVLTLALSLAAANPTPVFGCVMSALFVIPFTYMLERE